MTFSSSLKLFPYAVVIQDHSSNRSYKINCLPEKEMAKEHARKAKKTYDKHVPSESGEQVTWTAEVWKNGKRLWRKGPDEQ